jgi:hypothetical protein
MMRPAYPGPTRAEKPGRGGTESRICRDFDRPASSMSTALGLGTVSGERGDQRLGNAEVRREFLSIGQQPRL